MKIFTTPKEMYDWSMEQKMRGNTIGLVPTMGFFHEGHLTLMKRAGQLTDLVVTSLFVNPTQFGPNEDLDRYPRNFDRDTALSEKVGVKVLFAPTNEVMYSPSSSTKVQVSDLTENLCGASRPIHFAGVATVVTKLFNIVQPDVAVFGEKDFQQLAVIKRMVIDLNIPTKIVGHPIVRESDGLAMSSRNANLDPANREAALSLSQGIQLAQKTVAEGEKKIAVLKGLVEKYIASFSGTDIDYVSFVHSDTLEHVDTADKNTVLAIAVKIDNNVRLIDNGFLMQREN